MSTFRRCAWPAIFAMGLGLLSCEGRQADPSSVVTVEQKDLVLEVPVHGQLKSLDFEAINPPGDVTQIWQFKILRVLAEGTTVRAGQEVVAFDPSELKSSYTTPRASYAATSKSWVSSRPRPAWPGSTRTSLSPTPSPSCARPSSRRTSRAI